jgi:hypothetical protein
MGKGYIVKENYIIIQRDLTELDIFVKNFLDVLEKYSDYIIVSGFVSISTGRSRGTEDVDILVPTLKEDVFKKLFLDLEKKGFWCYQGDSANDVYNYIKNLKSVRFAKVNELFPNIEFIPFDRTKKAKYFEFTHPQKIKIKDFEFKIPPIEFEILYKEIILKGKKDFEDARHLRTFFSKILKNEKFRKYEPIISGELK